MNLHLDKGWIGEEEMFVCNPIVGEVLSNLFLLVINIGTIKCKEAEQHRMVDQNDQNG